MPRILQALLQMSDVHEPRKGRKKERTKISYTLNGEFGDGGIIKMEGFEELCWRRQEDSQVEIKSMLD